MIRRRRGNKEVRLEVRKRRRTEMGVEERKQEGRVVEAKKS